MTQSDDSSKAYAPWLWLLTILFAGRVAAQPLSLIWDLLPPFAHWQSGALPYGWLLIFQLLILGIMIRTAMGYSRGGVTASRRLGWPLLGFGGAYMALMLVRFALGQTLMQGHFWFDRPLPTMFHLVLAAFVLSVSRYHLRVALTND